MRSDKTPGPLETGLSTVISLCTVHVIATSLLYVDLEVRILDVMLTISVLQLEHAHSCDMLGRGGSCCSLTRDEIQLEKPILAKSQRARGGP